MSTTYWQLMGDTRWTHSKTASAPTTTSSSESTCTWLARAVQTLTRLPLFITCTYLYGATSPHRSRWLPPCKKNNLCQKTHLDSRALSCKSRNWIVIAGRKIGAVETHRAPICRVVNRKSKVYGHHKRSRLSSSRLFWDILD